MNYPWQFAGAGLQNALQGIGQAQGIGGGLNQAAGNLQNQYNNAYAQHGQGVVAGNAQNVYPPPPQFEENVPDDELEFEGKLTRWNPYALLAQYSPGLNSRKNHFGIECCQRCLMI